MEGAASNKYKNCSLGMKQRIGIAMALLGEPELLVLDEPINGLDADGMRIMRDVLIDVTKNHNCTVVVSSHVLGELEKIATHYGIVRGGKMICEMTAAELLANDIPISEIKTAKINLEEYYIDLMNGGKSK
ncbi:MAG: ATP-binding cassette domain-containing protein [Lachnospiraceae bacterium]|nr:ATP-binding cassette domain-containing protein [Ruminococcus sp.]MCM1275566.1 ATP-binding cassette domain-containing protein [Lachnospiraceae bacterium]